MKRREVLGALAVLSLFPSALVMADDVRSSRYRLRGDDQSALLTLELPPGSDYSYFNLSNPSRLVIDLTRVSQVAANGSIAGGTGLVKNIRQGAHGSGRRLVVDLAHETRAQVTSQPGARGGQQVSIHLGADPLMAAVTTRHNEAASGRGGRRPAIVAIDAGHGGKDPGCISQSDDYEKYVALGIAGKLHKRLASDPDFTPMLTRDTDIFIPLHQRVLLARDAKADMFMSIHADAAMTTRASGASVYILSEHGSSSAESRWMAESENSADRYASTRDSRIYSDNPDVQSTLLDLSMRGTMQASRSLGKTTLNNLKEVTNLHQHQVNSAVFAVLKSPDTPSMLVENGFMSNRQDAKRLLTDSHQQELAEALHQSVRDYFRDNPLYA